MEPQSTPQNLDFSNCKAEGRVFLRGLARKFFESVQGLLALQFEISREVAMGQVLKIVKITLYFNGQESAVPPPQPDGSSICVFRRQEFL